MLNIFIGYDPKEAVAYHTLAHSILRRATAPISITPLVRDHFRAFYTRERGPLDSTDFSTTRFLVPYLSGYQGYSVFMDCDLLCQADITQIWNEIQPSGPHPSLWVCKHDYEPRAGTKMLNQTQTSYSRKNWSSFMLFNNAKCMTLTPDYVNMATGLQLHRFAWLKDETLIGALPLTWNWLIGEYPPNPYAKFWHYTLGGPWWGQYRDVDHAKEWFEEYRHMTGCDYYPTQVWETPSTLATSPACESGPPDTMRPWPEKK